MNSNSEKLQETKNKKAAAVTQKRHNDIVSNYPASSTQTQLQNTANNSEQVKQAVQLQTMADANSFLPVQKKGIEEEDLQMKAIPIQKQGIEEEQLQMKAIPIQKKDIQEEELLQGKFTLPIQKKGIEEEELLQSKFALPIQRKGNNTGLPDNLKSGIENLSGYAMDDVKVHYNSDKPAKLQAHAYAQGTDIHIASGQEKHLPHEAWHVVQQKQGRVQPTLQMKGNINVNDDAGLENEADVMGANALSLGVVQGKLMESSLNNTADSLVAASASVGVLQGRWPTMGEATGGLALVGSGLGYLAASAATVAAAPYIVGGALVGGALGYGLSRAISSNDNQKVTTSIEKTEPVTTSTKKTKTTKSNGGGAKKSKSASTKKADPKADPKVDILAIATEASNDIVRERAVDNINKRATIFKRIASNRGIKKLSVDQIDQIENAWRKNNSDEAQSSMPQHLEVSEDDDEGDWREQQSHHHHNSGPKVIFDVNTEYAHSKRLLKWVKAPDSVGTMNLNGEGSHYAHEKENQARAAAAKGNIEEAIELLEMAKKRRESDFGGQLALDSRHEKAVTFIDNLITDLQAV